jgi:hypothetical protein
MPDWGAPVAQNVDVSPTKGIATLSGLMGLTQQKQAIESQGLTIQGQQAKLPALQAESQLQQQKIGQQQAFATQFQTGKDDQGNSLMGADGQPDPAKVIAMQGRIAPLVPEVGGAIMAAHTAKTQLQTAALSLDEKQRGDVMGTLQSVAAGADPSLLGPQLDQWAQAHPAMAGVVNNVKTTLLPHIINAPPAQRAQMANSMAALLQPGQQVQTQIQSGPTIDNGQAIQPTIMQPPNAGGTVSPAGGSFPKQLPPTTPIMRGNTPSYVGAPGAPPVQAAPELGQEAGVTGPVATNNAHFAGVQQAADGAQTRIGILGSIKELAPGAITGDAPTLKNFVSKVAGYFGIDAATAAQTNTDVLAKETALLASKAGNTDLALTLNQAATPNGHMQLGAINRTADQLIGQEKAKVAAQSFFSGTPTNSPLYAQKMQLWSQNGDPQAFEYASKSPTDQATMKAAMVKAGTWGALRQHMIKLHDMGLDPQ